jgi:hypothetical protein
VLLSQHYGQPGEWVDGEFNGGGTVNFGDLLTLAQNYGKSQPALEYSVESPAIQLVPEPSNLVLLSIGSASMMRFRAAGASSS